MVSTADGGSRKLASLPLFDEWGRPDFSSNLDWVADQLFGGSYKGIMRTKDGGAVFYRNEDVRYVAKAVEATHQTVDEAAASLRGRGGNAANGVVRLLQNNTLLMRGPEHLATKHLSTRRLTTQGVLRWADDAAIATRLQLDRGEAGSHFDFVHDFSLPLLTELWRRVLGVRPEESNAIIEALEEFRFASEFSPDAESIERASWGAEQILEVLPGALRREIDRGENPVLNELARDFAASSARPIRPPDPSLVFAQTLSAIWNPLGSGLAAVVHALVSEREAYARVRKDRSLIGVAYLEGIRLHGSPIFTYRQAASAFVYDGVGLPAGTPLCVFWAYANRDPAVFEDPNSYRLDRENRALQTSFGGGPYVCPGRNLVRMICEVVLGVLMDSDLDLVPTGPVGWVPNGFTHEASEMPVRMHRR